MSSRGFWRTGFHVLGLPARSSGFHGCFRVIRGFGSFSCRSSLTMTCGAAVRLAQSEAGQAAAVRVAVAMVAVVRTAEVLAMGLSGDETQMEMAAVGSEEAMLVAAGQGTLGMAHERAVARSHAHTCDSKPPSCGTVQSTVWNIERRPSGEAAAGQASTRCCRYTLDHRGCKKGTVRQNLNLSTVQTSTPHKGPAKG